MLTKAAQEFVTPLLVSSIAKNKIHSELFDDGQDGMAHINLSRRNDLIVVAPASADFLAKMANGFGDDLASTTILAADKKIIAAPAMNEKMWNFDANLQNITRLKKAGVIFVEPTKDELACGEVGVGKMKEPIEIATEIDEFFANQNRLKGKKIILTGGATREMIDPVRFISNDSSGKQAIYLAQTLREMGGDVEFIAGDVKIEIPLPETKITRTKSAKEMFMAVMQKIAKSKPSDTIFIGCAAVADYYVKNPSETKIKRQSNEVLTLTLEKNEDILKTVANHPNRPAFVIGFAAENENLLENAKSKLKNKNCDLILANEVENGAIFGAEESKSYLVSENKITDLGRISKRQIARIIASLI